jgi:thioredoxin 1
MNKYLLIPILSIIVLSACNSQQVNHVDSKTFAGLIAKGEGILLDVRTTGEYHRGHINNSTLISTNDPKVLEKIQLLQKDKPIYLYCLTGSRSNAVANYMVRNGFTKVYNLRRGILEWQQYGYKLTQGSAQMASVGGEKYSVTEFNNILQSNDLVLVDFHAPWCAPCKQMAPVVDRVKNDFSGKALIKKLDVQENQALQKIYQVEAIPGFVLFKNGKQVWKHTGIISYNELINVLHKYTKPG